MIRKAVGAALAATLTACPAVAQTSYCFSYELPKAYETPRFYAPMHYEVLNRNGLRVLLAEGEVKVGEGERLRAALDGNGQIDEVWLNSPGGHAPEGPKMGRLLRSRGSLVRLTGDHACISACSYAFLGGAIRIVDPGGYYGVHMFHSYGTTQMLALMQEAARILAKRAELLKNGKSAEAVDEAAAEAFADSLRPLEQESAKTAAIRARYLVEMSLSLDFMTDAFGTGSENVCYLNAQGLARYNVANAR